MKFKTALLFICLGLFLNTISQTASMKVTFTAEYNGTYAALDSVHVSNITPGW